MVVVANKLREQHSPSYIIEQLYDQARINNSNCVIESIRTRGEVEMLRSKDNFYLLAVDADPKVRYERIHERSSETDQITYEEFISNEMREFSSSDPNKQNLSKCIELADYKLDNNHTVERLYTDLKKILKEINIL